MRASAYTPEDLKEGLAELKNWRTPDHDVYEVAAQLFDERFRRSGEEILDLVLSLPSRRRLAHKHTALCRVCERLQADKAHR